MRPSEVEHNERDDLFLWHPGYPDTPGWRRLSFLQVDRQVDLIEPPPPQRVRSTNSHEKLGLSKRVLDQMHPLRTGYLYYPFYLQFLFVDFSSLSEHRYFK